MPDRPLLKWSFTIFSFRLAPEKRNEQDFDPCDPQPFAQAPNPSRTRAHTNAAMEKTRVAEQDVVEHVVECLRHTDLYGSSCRCGPP